MAEMEGRQDLNAFAQLYNELLIRYNNLGRKDDYFEMEHTDEQCWIPRYLRSYNDHELVRIFCGTIDVALEKLCKMENHLIRLENHG